MRFTFNHVNDWPSWETLAAFSKSKIENGLGAASWPKRVRAGVTKFATWFFPSRSWQEHDYDYYRGGGELQRWIADWRFFMGMVNDLRDAPRFFGWFGALLALTFFFMVLFFGWGAYGYGLRMKPSDLVLKARD